MRLAVLLLVLTLSACAADGGRYPVLDVVHGPGCGRPGAPPCRP